MSESFNPYYKWLGIPLDEQPPNYYRLLGVKLFEMDLEVINTAAEARMTQLRSYGVGPNAALSQRLLNEISTARLTLLNPQKRAVYDQGLRAQATANRPLPAATHSTAAHPAIPHPATPHPLAAHPAAPVSMAPAAMVSPTPLGGTAAPMHPSAPTPRTRKPRKQSAWVLPAAVIGGVALIGALVLAALMNQEEPPVAQGGGARPASNPVGEEIPPREAPPTPATEALPAANDPPPPGIEPSVEEAVPAEPPAAPAASVVLSPAASAALVKEWRGHSAPVTVVDISADGQWSVSGANDGTVRIGRTDTGGLLRQFQAHQKPIMDVRLSADAQFLATSSPDEQRVRVWSVTAGSQLTEIVNGDPGFKRLGFSADGARLMTGGNGRVRLFDARDGKLLHFHSGSAYALALSPDGAIAAFGGWFKFINFYSTDAWKKQKELTGHTGHVYALSFSDDGRVLASGSPDATIRIWDVASGQPITTLEGLGQTILDVALSADGRRLVARGRSFAAAKKRRGPRVPSQDSIRVWNVADGAEVFELEDVTSRPDLAPDGRRLLVGHDDGFVRLYQLPEAPPLSLPPSATPTQVANQTEASSEASAASSGSETPAPMDKSPPPTAEQQQGAMQVVEEVYKPDEERPPLERIKLAQDLLRVGRDSSGKPTEQFALFRQAAHVARAAGDARLMAAALDELGRRFEIDALELKLDELTALAKSAREEGVIDSLIAASQGAVLQAAARNRWDEVAALMDGLYSAAQRPAGRRYTKAVAGDRSEVNRIRRLWQQAQAGRTTLAATPDDPAANLAVGRWMCFYEGNWSAGLPHLARSGDAVLKALAQQDMDAGDGAVDATLRADLGDAWYEAAQNSGGEADEAKSALLRRAGHWYQRALPDASSQLVRIKIERRLAEIAKIPAPIAASVPVDKLPLGKWVYVLGLVEPETHSVAGTWLRFREAVGLVQPQHHSRFMVPVVLNGSYEFEFDFSSAEGRDICAAFPVGDRACELVMAGSGGRVGGLNFIDGQDSGNNPTKVTMNGLPKGQRVHVALRVEVEGDQARIAVDVADRSFVRWQGAVASLSQGGVTVPNPRCLGLCAAWGSPGVVFHTARVRLLSGEGDILAPSTP